MHKYFRYFLLFLIVLGGIGGVLISGYLIIASHFHIASLIMLVFVAYYAYGVYLGYLLYQNPDDLQNLRRIQIYFAFQIFNISSPLITYYIYSGLQLTVKLNLMVVFDLAGSGAQIRIGSSDPWMLGINIVALIVFFKLRNIIGKMQKQNISVIKES